MENQVLIIKEGDNKKVLLSSFDNLNILVESNAVLNLNIINLEKMPNCSINIHMLENSEMNIVCADFSDASLNLISNVFLDGINAKCTWKLASLSLNLNLKKFDISFTHNSSHTVSDMDNYGVALGESRIEFTGINHIKNGCIESVTKQNAKIIVFDEKSSGKASPILKIDENEVSASHGAVVGQLNDDHMFYLMSRGLSKNEARKLIMLGYLKPIAEYFDENEKQKIIDTIGGIV